MGNIKDFLKGVTKKITFNSDEKSWKEAISLSFGEKMWSAQTWWTTLMCSTRVKAKFWCDLRNYFQKSKSVSRFLNIQNMHTKKTFNVHYRQGLLLLFKPCTHNYGITAKKQRILTPHITQCKFITCHQTLTEALLTLPQLSLLLCICISCLAQIYKDVDDNASKKRDHSFTWTQLHRKMKYSLFKMTFRWSGGHLKGRVSSIHSTINKAFQHKNAALYLSALFWVNLPMWICFFSQQQGKNKTKSTG